MYVCSGTQCGVFQFLLILDLWDISFHAVVVFGLGKNLLFKSVLGRCVPKISLNLFGQSTQLANIFKIC